MRADKKTVKQDNTVIFRVDEFRAGSLKMLVVKLLGVKTICYQDEYRYTTYLYRNCTYISNIEDVL